ncbi:MAG: adenylate/guanylate cyclase domain-containing protein, partial [Spirochaetes bacterium]|nr:adenylate/guanylate cyclase domain-containing protein [Spirochaetota bacterium]
SMGIHYGQVNACNIGNSDRLEYSVLGDTLNTAYRIASACKVTGKQFLASETVYENIKDFFTCIPAGKIALKNKKESIGLYTIIPGLVK